MKPRASSILASPLLAADYYVGGQAVIEGVMMKSPNYFSVSVRRQDGKIKTTTKRFVSWTKKNKILALPFVRGIIVLIETLVLGYKTLIISANEAVEKNEKISVGELALTMLLALLMFVFLFKFIPLGIANVSGAKNSVLFNAVEGFAKIAILVLYIWAISLMKDVRRIFMYHGAEHKTINCLEAKKNLTVANIKKFSTAHPRCGTTFILFVLLLSIIVYLIVPMSYSFWMKLGLRLLLLPVIAGISYELIRAAGKRKSRVLCTIMKPGMWLQKLTTKEPDGSQIETAIASTLSVLRKEKAAKN